MKEWSKKRSLVWHRKNTQAITKIGDGDIVYTGDELIIACLWCEVFAREKTEQVRIFLRIMKIFHYEPRAARRRYRRRATTGVECNQDGGCQRVLRQIERIALIGTSIEVVNIEDELVRGRDVLQFHKAPFVLRYVMRLRQIVGMKESRDRCAYGGVQHHQ